MLTDPSNMTVGDLCGAALKECGAIGVGQSPLAEDLNDAQVRLQFMLQQWQVKRWLVYHLKTYGVVATGAESYTVGPGGQIDTGIGSQRPNRLESAFLRQIQNSQPNQIDYPLDILQSMEDYNHIALKSMQSFPSYAFLDTGYPLATLFAWPVPQASIYEVFITIREQLPQSFAASGVPAGTKTNQAYVFNIPWEYYAAMLYNLAIRLCGKYGISLSGRPDLVALAKESIECLRPANAQIQRLQMPKDLQRSGIYNIFSDRTY